MTARSLCWALAAFGTALLGVRGESEAHGLGERYDLPLPLSLYLAGAASVVALTFVLLALFATSRRAAAADPGQASNVLLVPDWTGERELVLLVRALSAALFLGLVLAGFVGSPDPFKNPLPVSVWVLGWVGIAYVSALIGNVWALINPWDNLFRLAEWVGLRSRRPLNPLASYPARLGAWPAVALFFGFAWLELVWPDRDRPAPLATAIVIYSAITWLGMALFGRRRWLEGGEFLSVAFSLLARFAILSDQQRSSGGQLALRPPAVGLLVDRPISPSLAAFVLLLLGSVTFDGLLETPLWVAFAEIGLQSALLLDVAEAIGADAYLVMATAGLVAVPLMFAACYLAVAWLMALAASRAGSTSLGIRQTACLFILTLVPIAIGYHLSHYLSYLLIAGQFIIPIASDPLALGWNLFGTRLYFIDIGIVGARFVWYASLVLIVGGHAIAVWLAHVQAERLHGSRHVVVASQVPMLCLMVGYTAFSLWILAQPIVEFRAG